MLKLTYQEAGGMFMLNKKILIIEDEKSIADLLSYSLDKEGYSTQIAHNGQDGMRLVGEFKPDMVVLDLMLPDMSGFDVCKEIVRIQAIPIIMLTAKSDIVDKILGIELGADDYITKPFDVREVITRIKSIFRRIELTQNSIDMDDEEEIKLGNNISIFPNRREVYRDGTLIDLTNKEYELLYFLASNRGIAFSRAQLLDRVWDFEYIGDTRTVDIHVQRLRKKLDQDSSTSVIDTIYGLGYTIR